MNQEINVLLPILATIIASVWGFSKFFYLEKKQENEKTSHLTTKCNIKKIGSKENFNVVELKVNIENKSDIKMFVHADYINVYGISMNSIQRSEEEYIKKSHEKILNKRYAFLHRFVNLKSKIIVFSGKIFDYDDYWWLDRKEKLEIKRIIYVPTIFDYAEMVVTIYYSINKDWLSVKTNVLENETGLCHEVIINNGKYKGQKFDWHNNNHLQLHNKYRNAEINNSSLLFIE